MKRLIFAAALMVVFLSGIWGRGKPELPLLLNAEELKEAIENRKMILVDFGRSQEDYSGGHIEGAVYLRREAIWTKVDGIPGMFPEVEEVAKALGEIGISRDKPVVIYDGTGNLWASRLFWALEYLGHDDVHLLDGGIQGWLSQGYSLSTDQVVPQQTKFEVDLNEQLLVEKSQILDGLANNEHVIVDARSVGEYRGEDVRSTNGGHIPGSVHLDWVNHVHSEERYFLSNLELLELYDLKGVAKDDSIVTLCQTRRQGGA